MPPLGEDCLTPSTAAAVANEFLDLAAREGVPIDQMKLQKLVYYAQAWHLALKGGPLFDEDLEAWPWGPVVRNVYIQTKDFGRAPVTQKIAELQKVGADPLNWRFETPEIADTDLKGFIRDVWDAHKRFSGVQLSNSAHARGEPWWIIKQRYGNLDQKPTIPVSLIDAVFKAKLKNAAPDNPAA